MSREDDRALHELAEQHRAAHGLADRTEPKPMQKLVIPVSNGNGGMRSVEMFMPVPVLTEQEWGRLAEILAAMKPALVRP